MSSAPTTPDPAPSRGRRAARMSGDERERAILEHAERLLAEKPLHAISIDELARGAGISRSSFYFYFDGKEAVLLSLLDRVITEADARRNAAFEAIGEPSRDLVRAGITAFHDTFRDHRAISLAAAQARESSPEVAELWSRVMQTWVDLTAGLIQVARDRGLAPASPIPARDLATSLNLMNERVLHATFAGEAPRVDEEGVVDALVAIWESAIYAGTEPHPTPGGIQHP